MQLAEHGTLTRYRQHQALNERPCRPCKDAYNDSVPEKKRAASRRYAAITGKAHRLLQLARPEEYKQYWAQAAEAYDQEQADLAAQRDAAWAAVLAEVAASPVCESSRSLPEPARMDGAIKD